MKFAFATAILKIETLGTRRRFARVFYYPSIFSRQVKAIFFVWPQLSKAGLHYALDKSLASG